MCDNSKNVRKLIYSRLTPSYSIDNYQNIFLYTRVNIKANFIRYLIC